MSKHPRSKEEWGEFIPPASRTRGKRKPRSATKPTDKQYILDNIVRTDTNSVPQNQLNLFKPGPLDWDPNI